MSSLHLMSTLLAPEELALKELAPEAPDRSTESHQQPTLLQDPGREGKIFLTSLLLTSALVTFALSSLPQIFSLARLLPRSTSLVQATSTLQLDEHSSLPRLSQSVASQSVASQSIASQSIASQSVQTLTLNVSPTSSANVILRISPTSGAKEAAIATPHLPTAPSKSYTVSVTIQPLPQ